MGVVLSTSEIKHTTMAGGIIEPVAMGRQKRRNKVRV
jgi:hypothetical protein